MKKKTISSKEQKKQDSMDKMQNVYITKMKSVKGIGMASSIIPMSFVKRLRIRPKKNKSFCNTYIIE